MFAKQGVRMQTRLFFPALFKNEPNWLKGIRMDPICEKFYDKCLRPAIEAANLAAASHWPVNYEHAKMLYRKDDGTYTFKTMDVSSWIMADFQHALLEKMDDYPEFKGAFWQHEIRGTKDATQHAMTDRFAREEALRSLMDHVVMEDINMDEWKIDVALEVNSGCENLLWLTLGHARVLDYALPGVTPEQVRRLLDSDTKFQRDDVAQLSAIAGFRLTLT